MKTTLVAISLACLLAFATGCSLFDPAEPVPSYIYIPSFNFETEYSTEFTDSEKFTEVWVFVDDALIGVYDLPAEVPVLKEGEAQVRIQPGIRNNGIASSRKIYPMIQEYVVWRTLKPNENDTIIPEFRYKEDVNIINADDFENATVFTLGEGSQGSFSRVTGDSQVFEGEGSGLGYLSEGEDILRARTNEQQYDLPKNRLSWLEMNYKCNNSMAVGVYGVSQSQTENQYVMVLNSTEGQWNKIYIELLPSLSTFPNAAYFELYIESLRDNGNTGEIQVFIDNLKIVHF